MLPFPRDADIPEDVEWIVIGFLPSTDFYSELTIHYLSKELRRNMSSGVAGVVLNFSRVQGEFEVFSGGERVTYFPYSTGLEEIRKQGIFTTFCGADILLDEITPEEKRFFKSWSPGKLPNYSRAFVSKNINLVRYLIRMEGNVVAMEDLAQLERISLGEPDRLQRKIMDLMVRFADESTLEYFKNEESHTLKHWLAFAAGMELKRRSQAKTLLEQFSIPKIP